MWKDKITKRTPREDFVLSSSFDFCGTRCPQYGHRTRLDEPGYNDADVFGESRVRALHAVLDIRSMANELVGQEDVAEMLELLAMFNQSYDAQAIDATTFYQLINIRAQLARFIARRLFAILSYREVNTWANGFREGARFVREHRDQFQIKRCY